jgi:hypothetical protein
MNKSQNTKNEQLTEQWKKGELAKVKKQLAIAVEALNEYADEDHWCGYFGIHGYERAEQALRQIEELKQDETK